jgi:hypothetical protein
MTPTSVCTAFEPYVTSPTCQAGFGAGVRVATGVGWVGPQAAGFGPEPWAVPRATRLRETASPPIREAAVTPRIGARTIRVMGGQSGFNTRAKKFL